MNSTNNHLTCMQHIPEDAQYNMPQVVDFKIKI